MFTAYFMTKIWDVSFTVNGFLAGLVAITCPCYWVSPTGSIILGGIAGVIVVFGVELLEWLRIDDPIGAVPVHGICGICSPAASSGQRVRSLLTTAHRLPAFSTTAASRC
jgi:Amt family ammonium transporter